MTVTVAVSTGDTLVLATDSALTQSVPARGGGNHHVVFNGGEKLFNLHRDLPIGVAMWGGTAIGGRSIVTTKKELRRRLMGSHAHPDWKLDVDDHSLADVINRLQEIVHDGATGAAPPTTPTSFFVAGFTPATQQAECYQVTVDTDGQWSVPASSAGTFIWPGGQWELMSRVVNGVTGDLAEALQQLTAPALDAEGAEQLVTAIKAKVFRAMTHTGMPVADAVDLARWLVDSTIQFVRFTAGGGSVGGPIEIAALTRDEGFKWVQRKHYYQRELNPTRSVHG